MVPVANINVVLTLDIIILLSGNTPLFLLNGILVLLGIDTGVRTELCLFAPVSHANDRKFE
jgi:hypothetical protein